MSKAEETKVIIDGEEVPALYSEITEYTLVGLKDETGNIVVYIEEGTYTLDETLTFDERDSATGDFYIKYQGEGNVVISGGEIIKNFVLYDAENNIYSAKVSENALFRQLYMNGEKLIRAKSNDDYSTKIIGASRFNADGTMIPENLNTWSDETLVQADYGEIYLNADEFQDFDNNELK